LLGRVMAAYVPKPLAVPVTYFSADLYGQRFRRLSPEVEVITIPSSHYGCITTDIESLAGELRNVLERLDARTERRGAPKPSHDPAEPLMHG
jgi:oxalate---CoA ligase